MRLIYHPEGSDEPQVWPYDPRRLMSVERELIERHTERDFAAFSQGVLSGNSRCRRVLLWTMLRREHRSIRLDDVDFAWDELRLEYSRQDLQLMLDRSGDQLTPGQVEQLREQLDGAYDDPSAGKAQLPIAD